MAVTGVLITALGAHLDQDEANARALANNDGTVSFMADLALREVGRKRTTLAAADEMVSRGDALPPDLEFEIHQMAISHDAGE